MTKEVGQITDEAYFEYLLNTYQKLVYTICYRTCGNPFDAEDLTQETYIAVYKNITSFDRNCEKAWISKIAINKCLDFLKSSKRKVQPVDEEFLEQMEDEYTPEMAYLQKESRNRLYESCQRLKEPYRTIATEHFYYEKTVSEIAGERERNVKTVQTQLYRARGMLKKMMKEDRKICRKT